MIGGKLLVSLSYSYYPVSLVLIPLVGALIGYLTNWVAIRMLFRPHREKRLFGVRVPFTPGLIPRKRAELAASIGQAVGEHLLTEEAIAARFEDEGVKAKLAELVHNCVQGLLTRELADLDSLIPEGFRDEWEKFIAGLKGRIAGWVDSFLEDERLEGLLREQVRAKVGELLARPLGELLPDEVLDGLPAQLDRLLERVVEDERFERRVHELVDERLDSLLREGRPLGSYLPPGLREALYAKLEELLPEILDRLVAILEDERVRLRIKVHLYELVGRLLSERFREDSLWDQVKLTLIETFVISPEELKERLDRGVEELAPQVAELVRSPEVRRRVHRALARSLDGLLGRRLTELGLDGGALERVKEKVAGVLLGLARSEELREQLLRGVEEGLAGLRARPLREVLGAGAAVEEKGRTLADKLTEQILGFLRGRSAREALSRFLEAKLDELLRRPLGRLGDRLPRELVEGGEELAAEHLRRLLQRETPRIVAALDIKGLVREKVEEFSTEEVERLIVGVTGDQLKAITWFGAVLGFLIGLVQVGLLLISR